MKKKKEDPIILALPHLLSYLVVNFKTGEYKEYTKEELKIINDEQQEKWKKSQEK